MARERRPSGLPPDRIVRPVFGHGIDLDDSLEHRHEGFRRVRRTMLVVTLVVVAGVVAIVVAGDGDAARGAAALFLAPLAIILVGTHVAVVLTRPERR